MKKKILFLSICAVLILSSQVFAESISQIGKKVSGEASVYLNGNLVKNAIIVDNSSYAPVRDIAEALNVEVAFEKNEKGTVIKLTTPEMSREEVNELIWKKANIEANIIGAQNEIEQANSRIETYTKDLERDPSIDYAKFLEERISTAKEEIIQAQQDIITYTNELLELESAN